MDTQFIGDRPSYNPGLDEQDFSTYLCPFCGFEKEVAEEYDLASGYFFPIRFLDTICKQCDDVMERKRKGDC